MKLAAMAAMLLFSLGIQAQKDLYIDANLKNFDGSSNVESVHFIVLQKDGFILMHDGQSYKMKKFYVDFEHGEFNETGHYHLLTFVTNEKQTRDAGRFTIVYDNKRETILGVKQKLNSELLPRVYLTREGKLSELNNGSL